MPSFATTNFGSISFEQQAVLEFPSGLPGFEERRRFLALHFPTSDPLIYLQSLDEPGLCFITLPVLTVAPDYRLDLSAEDRERIGLSADGPLRIGQEVLCVAVVSLHERGPTANLLAPVVVNLHNLKAVQAVMEESDYPLQHALLPDEAPVCS